MYEGMTMPPSFSARDRAGVGMLMVPGRWKALYTSQASFYYFNFH